MKLEHTEKAEVLKGRQTGNPSSTPKAFSDQGNRLHRAKLSLRIFYNSGEARVFITKNKIPSLHGATEIVIIKFKS